MNSKYNKYYFRELEKSDLSEMPRNIRNLEEIKKYKRSGELLDLGIGAGLFLKLSQKSGFDVLGIDISGYTVNRVISKLKLAAIRGNFEKMDFKDKKFDVINMRHTIEHLKNPSAVLKKAFKILKPKGIIYISTPNSHGIHSKIYGPDWPHWSVPYHLHFFSKKSLTELVVGVGFKIITAKTEEITIYNSIHAFLKRIGIAKSLHNPSDISNLFDNFLAKIGLGEGLVVIARKE